MEENEFAAKVIDVITNVMGLGDDNVTELMVPVYSDKLELACMHAYNKCKAMKLNYITLDAIVYCILQNKETSAYHFMSNVVIALGGDIDIFLQSMKMMANIVDDEQDVQMPIVIPAALEACIENMNAKYTKGEETNHKACGKSSETTVSETCIGLALVKILQLKAHILQNVGIYSVQLQIMKIGLERAAEKKLDAHIINALSALFIYLISEINTLFGKDILYRHYHSLIHLLPGCLCGSAAQVSGKLGFNCLFYRFCIGGDVHC